MSRINPALLPDDLDALYARADRLGSLIDKLSDYLGAVEARIWEMEHVCPSEEPTGFRAMYYAIKL